MNPRETVSLQMPASDILLGISCVVQGRSATYLSGPITTGKRLFEFERQRILLGQPCAVSDTKVIVLENEKAIFDYARELRSKGVLVIEPASLFVAGWTQRTYYEFWYEVFRRFVNRVVLLDGWEYSVGCANEFFFAHSARIPVETVQGQSMSVEEGRQRVKFAAQEMLSEAKCSDRLSGVATSLLSLV